MSVYIPVELQRRVRAYFGPCCAYCRVAKDTVVDRKELEAIAG